MKPLADLSSYAEEVRLLSSALKDKYMKKIIWRGAYGIEFNIPAPKKAEPHLIEKQPATHDLNECGRHYNIWEPDPGFAQERFFDKRKMVLKGEKL